MAQQVGTAAQPPFPQEAYGYGGMYTLGNPVAAYKVSFRGSIVLGILCLPFAVLFGAVGLSGDSSGTTVLFMVILTLLCLAGAGYYLVLHPVLHSSWRIFEYTGGFLVFKGSNNILACRWDQVAFIWQRIVRHYRNGVYTGTSYKYTVQRSDGVRVVLTEMFRNVNQLGDHLQREVSNRLAPQALAAAQAGQTLPFGQLSLNRQGLITSKGILPWGDIQQVTAARGFISVLRRGQRRGALYGGVDKVPNLYVFLVVAEALIKSQR